MVSSVSPSSSNYSSDHSASSAVTTNTSSSPELHTCPYKDCNKSFSKKYNLKAHLRLHTGEEPFECDRPDCRKKFKWRSSLSSHSVWHSRKDNAALPTPLKKKPTSTPSTSSASTTPRKPANLSPAQQSFSTPKSKKKRPRSDVSLSSSRSSTDVMSLGTTPVRPAKKLKSEPLSQKVELAPEPLSPVDTEPILSESPSPSSIDTEVLLPTPGSPVTSDGSCDDLQLDHFSSDILQPLLSSNDDELPFTAGDVDAIIGSASDLFPYDSCVPLNQLDTRFTPFDMDNFCMPKMDL